MVRNRLCFIIVKGFLSKMMKKKQKLNISNVLFLIHLKHKRLKYCTIQKILKKLQKLIMKQYDEKKQKLNISNVLFLIHLKHKRLKYCTIQKILKKLQKLIMKQ